MSFSILWYFEMAKITSRPDGLAFFSAAIHIYFCLIKWYVCNAQRPSLRCFQHKYRHWIIEIEKAPMLSSLSAVSGPIRPHKNPGMWKPVPTNLPHCIWVIFYLLFLFSFLCLFIKFYFDWMYSDGLFWISSHHKIRIVLVPFLLANVDLFICTCLELSRGVNRCQLTISFAIKLHQFTR